MLLYDSRVSGNCWKVRQMLAHLGADYERREVDVVDRSNRMELLGGLNPALRVPTLVFDDGRALGESHAIIWHLAEGTQHLPEDAWDRAQVMQWLCFEQYSLEPSIAVARFWLHVSPSAPDPGRLKAWQTSGYAALDALDGHLNERDYLVGERYSIADIALYAYTHVAPEGGFDLGRYPAINGWLERVAAQERHITITE
jgi:glutathione S-transferase